MSLQQLTLENKPLEDIKPYRWITLEEQKQFHEFLQKLGINYSKLDWCASEWEKYRCSYDPIHTKKVRYLPCGLRGICPCCKNKEADLTEHHDKEVNQKIMICRRCHDIIEEYNKEQARYKKN